MRSFRNKSQRRGSVLILVLIVLASMVILSLGLAYRTRIEMRLAHSNAQRTKVYYLALGGIERIKTLLSEKERSAINIAGVCQFTSTSQTEGLFDQLKDFAPVEGQLLTYSLRDESGYFDINKSNPTSWISLGSVSRELAACILDWTDEDEDVSPSGAETDFYQGLLPPYAAKNLPIASLKELLFVRTVSRSGYLGKNLNESERDIDFRVPDNSREGLGLVQIFTVYGNADGKVNINTVSSEILAAHLRMDGYVADSIITYRPGDDGQLGTEDDPFATLEDLGKIQELVDSPIEAGEWEQYFCVDSEYFRIFSYARVDDTFECCLMAIVKWTEDEPKILYLERLL
ncbi:general secretion pathway protein GspK [Planctomycetota bacterium]